MDVTFIGNCSTSHNTFVSFIFNQLLASAIRMSLCDVDYIEGLVGLPLADLVTDNLKMLAECSYYVLCTTSVGKIFWPS